VKLTVAKTTVCFVLILITVCAAAAQQRARSILEQRTVRMRIETATEQALCLGVRLRPLKLPETVELIVTAGHCVNELTNQVPGRQITLASYDSTHTASAYCWMWSRGNDVALLLAGPSLGYSAPLQVLNGDPPSRREIIGMISIGGGAPTPAMGVVTSNDANGIHALMPGGPGSSGGPVVDLDGRLVGIITSGLAYSTGGAGFYTNLLPSADVIRFVNNSMDFIADRTNKITRFGTCDPAGWTAPVPPTPAIPIWADW